MGINGSIIVNNIFNVISSSSKTGNCYIYNKDIMVDIGVSFNKIKPYIKDIKLLLLSHQHSDHINKTTLKKLMYEKPTIMVLCGEWLVQTLVDIGIPKKNIFVIEIDKKYDLGKYIIEPVLAIHDVDNCGYKITIKETNYKIFHITDTNSVQHIEAKNYNLYCIESNYNEELMQEHIQECLDNGDSENKLFYLQRAMNNHLSSKKTYDFLIENMKNDSKYILLHKSNYNYKEE